MKKSTVLSILLHLIFFAIFAPWLITRMEFSKKEEQRRTEEVRQRELERKEFERLKRETQKLTEKQAKKLKREAEKRKLEEIEKELKRLRKLREEIAEKRKEELRKIEERSREDILAMEHIDINRLAQKMEDHIHQMTNNANRRELNIGAFANSHHPNNGRIDDLRIIRKLLTDEQIANPATVDWDLRWQLEGNLMESVSGKLTGELHRGAKFTVSEVEGEQCFQGNGEAARASLQNHAFGDEFTLLIWCNTTPRTDSRQLLIANCHSHSYNIGLRFMIEQSESMDTKAGRIVLETSGDGGNNKGKTLYSKENTYPFGEWVQVALRFNKTEQKAEIFVNGMNVTEAVGEIAPNTFTEATHIDGTLAKEATELKEKIASLTPTPESANDIKEQVQTLADKVMEKMDLNKGLHDVRSSIKNANDAAEALVKELDELAVKTDLPKMNDTSAAKADLKPLSSPPSTSPARMYEEAVSLEKDIAEANADIQAAKDATINNTSYAEAREGTHAMTPPRPDLAAVLGQDAPDTIGDLNEVRSSLSQAKSEIRDMNARAESILGKDTSSSSNTKSGDVRSGAQFISQAARISAAIGSQSWGSVVNMTSYGGSESIDASSQGLRGDYTGEGADMILGAESRGPSIDQGAILAKALPGRRFTKSSTRRGWLYIDTWYVIGPWENNSKVNYNHVHPPEYGIDFDAVYSDGKFADDPSHRDHFIRWEFYQSDQARCQPPRVYAASTYYAYTDIWFEEARTMLIAVASDDASRVWLNKEIIWQDEGLSPWKLGEGYRRVHFKKGYNDLLIRIENGPIHCVWSVLLCPPEVLK